MSFRGTDTRGFPYSFLKTVVVKSKEVKGEPYKVNMKNEEKVKIRLFFYGWLGQPYYDLELDQKSRGLLKLVYDPLEKTWLKNKTKWIEE